MIREAIQQNAAQIKLASGVVASGGALSSFLDKAPKYAAVASLIWLSLLIIEFLIKKLRAAWSWWRTRQA